MSRNGRNEQIWSIYPRSRCASGVLSLRRRRNGTSRLGSSSAFPRTFSVHQAVTTIVFRPRKTLMTGCRSRSRDHGTVQVVTGCGPQVSDSFQQTLGGWKIPAGHARAMHSEYVGPEPEILFPDLMTEADKNMVTIE
jgi:hypothetical protein